MKKTAFRILFLFLLVNLSYAQEGQKTLLPVVPNDSIKTTPAKTDTAKSIIDTTGTKYETASQQKQRVSIQQNEKATPKTEQFINTAVQREQRIVDIINTIDLYSILEIFLLVLITSGFFKLINKTSKTKSAKKYSRFSIPIAAIAKIIIIIVLIYLIITLLFGSSKEITLALLLLLVIFFGVASVPFIKNLIGGFFITYNSPFEKGDYIKVASYEGRVSKIGWRFTSIVTDDESMIHVPNSIFFQNPVENINTGQVEHLISVVLAFSQELNPGKIIPVLKESAISNPYAFNQKQPEVYLKEIDMINKANKFEINLYIFNRQFENEAVAFLNESVLKELKNSDLVN